MRIVAAAGMLACACAGRHVMPWSDVPPVQFSKLAPAYWPTDGWRESSPEDQGLRAGPLADALVLAREKHIAVHTLLFVRHGVVVLDAAFYPFAAGARHDLASVTKSITSVLAGMALQPDARLLQVLKRSIPDKVSISIDDLLAMQSGIDCGRRRGEPELRAAMQSADWVRAMLELPMHGTPGTEFAYCSCNCHLV